MAVRFGIILFPGSNCDHDAVVATTQVMGQEGRLIWHKEESLGDVDVVIIPGGFSFGDYLRSGAIARFSPIMKSVVDFANGGGVVIGICNGFQILCEAGLLPGTLARNASLRFICKSVNLRVDNADTIFTSATSAGDILDIPIAHGDGRYFASKEELDKLEANNQVVLRYCEADGSLTSDSNPNGSDRNIAGVINEAGNVLGMMPHPERHVDPMLGSSDGKLVFESLIESFVSAV